VELLLSDGSETSRLKVDTLSESAPQERTTWSATSATVGSMSETPSTPFDFRVSQHFAADEDFPGRDYSSDTDDEFADIAESRDEDGRRQRSVAIPSAEEYMYEINRLKVDTLSEASTEEVEKYEQEVARWVGLRATFKKGAHVKTVEGHVGVVKEDAKAEGYRASEVQLQLADGSETSRLKVDTLSESTAEEYEQEAARWSVKWPGLRTQFQKRVYAKTAEGEVGVVVKDAAAEGS
jgi:hypothetical protein